VTSHPSHPPRSAPEQQFKPFVKKRNRHKPCLSVSIERDLSLLKLQYYHDCHELQSTAAIVGYSYKYAYTHKQGSFRVRKRTGTLRIWRAREREPIWGSGGGAPTGVHGQSPWSGGRSPLKLKAFYCRRANLSLSFK